MVSGRVDRFTNDVRSASSVPRDDHWVVGLAVPFESSSTIEGEPGVDQRLAGSVIDEQDRPDGISFLAIVSAASGALGGLLLLVAGDGQGGLATLIGWIIVLVTLGLAYGFWALEDWAWPLGVAVYAFAFVEAVWLLFHSTLNTNLVVAPLIVLYLNRPDIKQAFGREA